MYDLDGKVWFSWGRAYRITVCAGAVLRVLGTVCLAAAKVRRIRQVIRRWGGIHAATSRMMSARPRYPRVRRLTTMMITTGSAILGLDSVHDKRIKTKL
jgi:HAMP domain-containing protein